MRPFRHACLAALLALSALPARADEVIAVYAATIGVDDLYNSNGQRLSAPWQVLRQDRANFHRYDISQPGDEWDPVFDSMDARAQMEALVRAGTITPQARAGIMSAGSTVVVEVWGAGNRLTWVNVDVYR